MPGRVTNHPNLPQTVVILPLKILYPGKPPRCRQPKTIGHLT